MTMSEVLLYFVSMQKFICLLFVLKLYIGVDISTTSFDS